MHDEAESILMELLKKIPAIQKIQVRKNVGPGIFVDLYLKNDRFQSIRAIPLERAYPRYVEMQIKSTAFMHEYRIFIAPYISEASAELCESAGVGYCDYSGNCLISTDNFYISNKGNPNKYPKEDFVKTVFNPSAHTTSIILRELLKDVSKTWRIKTLAETTGCSIGMVSRIKTYLCEQRWAAMDENGLKITDPAELMEAWSSVYSIKKSINCYTLDQIPVFETKCYDAYNEMGINNLLTGFSGGVRYTPVVRYAKVHIWLNRRDVTEFIDYTGCKQVDSGANVILYPAESEEFFWDSRDINGSRTASPVQVYLDCMQMKGRGEDMAKQVFYREIWK